MPDTTPLRTGRPGVESLARQAIAGAALDAFAARLGTVQADGWAGLVWAWCVTADDCRPVAPADLHGAIATVVPGRRDWLWLHFDLADQRTAETLSRLQQARAEADSKPWPDEIQHGFLSGGEAGELHFGDGVIHGALPDQVIDLDGRPGDAAMLAVVLDERIVATGRRWHLRGVEALRDEAGARSLGRRPNGLLDAWGRHQAAMRTDHLRRWSDRLDQIEDRLLIEDRGIDRRVVLRARHVLVRAHRELTGLARLFDRLEQEIRHECADGAPPAWADVGSLLHHLQSTDDQCLALLDRARLLQEEASDQLAAQTNRQLYVLSILTAALVPPTIVVGVFGMNTGGLPLTQRPDGFALALALCLLSSLLVLGALVALGIVAWPRRGRDRTTTGLPREAPGAGLDEEAAVGGSPRHPAADGVAADGDSSRACASGGWWGSQVHWNRQRPD